MNINTVTKSGRLTHNGMKLAAYIIDYPEIEDMSVIRDFCRSFAEAFEAALQSCIHDMLIAEYEASPDPRKRFRYRPAEIRMRYRVTLNEERIFSMFWQTHASRNGKTLFCCRHAQTWNTEDGTLFTAHDFGVGRKRNSSCDFYIEEGELVLLKEDSETRHSISRCQTVSRRQP